MWSRAKRLWRQHLRPWWHEYQWLVIAGAVVVAFVLTYMGVEGPLRLSMDRLYRTFEKFGLARPDFWTPPGQSSRIALRIAGGLMVCATLFALWTVWATIFRQQWQLLRLRFWSGHAVICGGGATGVLLAIAFRDRGDRVVLVDHDPKSSGLEQSADRGVITMVGDGTDPLVLHRVRIERAAFLFALCGEDSVNADIAVRASTAPRRGVQRLNVFVRIRDLDLYHLIRERELAADRDDKVRIQCWNLCDSGARVLLSEHPIVAPAAAPRGVAHVVVVGLGRFGESVLVHAARSWSADHRDPQERLVVSVVDAAAARKLEALAMRLPALRATCDLAAYDVDPRSLEFQQGTFLVDCMHRAPVDAMYICLEDEPAALSAALAIGPHLYERAIRAVVRVNRDAGLAALLPRHRVVQAGRFAPGLALFGILDRTCRLDTILRGSNEALARTIHENYLLSEQRVGHTAQDNPSMVPWHELDEDRREANRRQADDLGLKLAAIDCHLAPLTNWGAPLETIAPAEVERLAVMEHDRWVAEHRSSGWTYGPTKDAMRRRTPGLVPWEQLPDNEREKDRNAVRLIPHLLARAGFRLMRTARKDA